MEKGILFNFKSDTHQAIDFYEMDQDGCIKQGTTVEELIRVATERLMYLNGKFPSRENSLAITKLEEAKHWLNARTADRVKRGVEGKHIA